MYIQTKYLKGECKIPQVNRLVDILNESNTNGLTYHLVKLTKGLSALMDKDTDFVGLKRNVKADGIEFYILGVHKNGTRYEVVTALTINAIPRLVKDYVYTEGSFSQDEHLAEFMLVHRFLDLTHIIVKGEYQNKGIAKTLINQLWDSELNITIVPTCDAIEKIVSGRGKVDLKGNSEINSYSNSSSIIEDFNLIPRSPETNINLETMTKVMVLAKSRGYIVNCLKGMKPEEVLKLKMPNGNIYESNMIIIVMNPYKAQTFVVLPQADGLEENIGMTPVGLNYVLDNVKCASGLLRFDETLATLNPYENMNALKLRLVRRTNIADDSIGEYISNPNKYINKAFTISEMTRKYKLI